MPANSPIKNWHLFALLLGLLFIDQTFSLVNFGFLYTDLDQTVLWNGAMDYSRGIFHEPFFYGQAYNYMLEALLAVPLLWLGIPVYNALPLATSFLSIIPFAIFGSLLMKKGHPFWALLSLSIPIILPVEYGLLTTMSRGFVQAHLFVPLLLIPLLNPGDKKNSIILFLAAGACLISNNSSLLIVAPTILWVFLHQFKSARFYFSSLLVTPFFAMDYLARTFYEAHPEKVLHKIHGLTLDSSALTANILNFNLFEHLFPFASSFGFVYWIFFFALALIALKANLKKEFVLVISIILLLLLTLAVPKFHHTYDNAGVLFTSSRLYLFVPMLSLMSAFLIFRKRQIPQWSIVALLIISGLMTVTKGVKIQDTVDELVATTSFPIAKNQDLLHRWVELEKIVTEHKVDLIIHENENGWLPIFDSYVFNPLAENELIENPVISVTVNGDRRTWLYADAVDCRTILLNGFNLEPTLLANLDYNDFGKNRILIQLQDLKLGQVSEQLELNFGIAPK